MWLTDINILLKRDSILKLLESNSLSQKFKEELVPKRIRRIRREIKRLTPKEVIRYLFFTHIPAPAKMLISEYIQRISISCEAKNVEKYKQIKDVFLTSNLINENFIKSNHCPDTFKKIIIDELYKGDLVEVISKKTTSTKVKKIIIDLALTLNQTIELLNAKNLQPAIIDYLITTRLTTDDDIEEALKNVRYESILEKIIIRKININNIFKITRWIYGSTNELIYKLKARDVEDFIKSLTKENIFKILNDYDTPNSIAKRIYEERKDLIPIAIKHASKENLEDLIFRERIPELVNQIIELRKNTVDEIIRTLSRYSLINWLNLKCLPNELKEYLMYYHKRELNERINSMRLHDVTYTVLKKDATIPRVIVERVFEKHKDALIEEIKKEPSSDIITSITYGSYIIEYRRLMIDHCINKDNIEKLLSGYGTEDILDYVLETKNDIFREMIKPLEFKEIIKLKIGRIPEEITNSIIEKNKDLVITKLEKVEKEEQLELLNNKLVHPIIKKLILINFNISEQEANNCLCLISITDPKIVLENYETIKELITSMDINFQSFLQYGSGSTKHSNWLTNLINIINNNEVEEFKQCKNYFFKNYYEQEENTVYTITSFLELIDNFNKYKEICITLKNNNKQLSKNDKSNIRFLFNISNTTSIEVPNSLEELSSFKLNLYKDYIRKIKNNSFNEHGLKGIFNDLLFCNSKSLFEFIGGSGALRTIKKENENNVIIQELASEIMMYSTIIEMVNDTNNYEGLKTLLVYIFSDIDILTKFQNMFSDLERKIVKLYELDSMNNLSKLNEARKMEYMLDTGLSNKYGGEVFDYRDKNYCLYAHVLSARENIEDLLNGTSTGNSNFISVSPVSYRGQKYYYNRSEVVIAYDTLPNGNFICSSVTNMGSNFSIKANSSEVDTIARSQRGILETSAVTKNNSEALLYRENLKPCGLIIPGGREPTPQELEYHRKYGLPFILTQELNKPITDPKMVFNQERPELRTYKNKDLETIIDILRPNVVINKETEEYTGREVALITDCHSMYEPTLAALEDIRRHGITEIYSLGDNVGLGPSPCETFDLLEEYGVISVAGNSEYYNTLGTECFDYFYKEKEELQEWTATKLGASRISKIKLFPASIDLTLGKKKIALCHFANDIRWNYSGRNTHTYQSGFEPGVNCRQFLYTNSDEAKKRIGNCIVTNKRNISKIKGYISAQNEPIFGGKLVTDYDSIIQGHVHFDMEDQLEDTKIYTLRAVGMGYKSAKEEDKACYYILRERKDGTFEIEQQLVEFNRNNLLSKVYTSGLPHKDRLLEYIRA